MPPRALAGLRVGVFGKGGSGKSTVVVLLARVLRERGYGVLVLDADSTNVGLAQALGLAGEPDPLLDYFGGMVFSGGAVTCPVDDPTTLAGARLSLAALPPQYVGRSGDGICLLVAGKLGALGPGAGCDGPIVKIARDLQVTGIGPEGVTLVDFKAGFEDSARGAVTSLDWALVVVDPTPAAIRMASDLHRLVNQMRAGVPPAVRHLERADLQTLAISRFREAPVRGVLAVLNRVPDRLTRAYLRAALERDGPRVIGALPQDPSIQQSWLRGAPVDAAELGDAVVRLVERLEACSETSAGCAHSPSR